MPDHRADEVIFFNRSTGLKSTTVQGAIEELIRSLEGPSEGKISDFGSGNIITQPERAKLTGIERGAKDDQTASEVPYSNDGSDLLSSSVQSAIDEIANKSKSLEFHNHSHNNHKALDAIDDAGSGVVISKQERSSLHKHDNCDILNDVLGSGSGKIITVEERNKLNGIAPNATGDQDASSVPYNDTITGIGADNIQNAIEETNKKIDNKKDGHDHLNLSVLGSLEHSGSKRVITEEERTKLLTISPGATVDQTAIEVEFDPTSTIYMADDVQNVLQEVSDEIKTERKMRHSHSNHVLLDDISEECFITKDEREKLTHIEYGARSDQDASEVAFDSNGSLILSDNVQDAIDEVAEISGHIHSNKDIIDGIKDIGSGKIITEFERAAFTDLSTAIKGFHQLHSEISNGHKNIIDCLQVASHKHENIDILSSISSLGSGKIITDTERVKLVSIEPNATQDQSASEVPFDNSSSNINSTNLQNAVCELDAKVYSSSLRSHIHANLDVISSLSDPGCGRIITSSERSKLNSISEGATRPQIASSVPYDASEVTISSDTVQGAIDELSAKIESVDIVNHYHDNESVLCKIEHHGSGRIMTNYERDKLMAIPDMASPDQTASTLPFDNSICDTDANTVQKAIEDMWSCIIDVSCLKHEHNNTEQLHNITDSGSGCIVTKDERNKLFGIEEGATGDQEASEVAYNNQASGIESNNVQSAIDELITRAAHKHDNLNVVNRITDNGSGKIITDEERVTVNKCKIPHRAVEILYKHSNVSDELDDVSSNIYKLKEITHIHDNQLVLSGLHNVGSGNVISTHERDKLNSIEPGATADQSSYDVVHNSSNVGNVLDNLEGSVLSLSNNTHMHENTGVINCIFDSGSGSIISSAERAKLVGISDMATADQKAIDVPYNNLSSPLEEDNVQDAITVLAKYVIDAKRDSHAHLNANIINQIQDIGSGMIMSDYERNKLSNISDGAKDDQQAKDVPYIPDGSDLESSNLQSAIDEIMIRIRRIENMMHFHDNYDIIDSIDNNVLVTNDMRDKLDSMEYGAATTKDAIDIPFDDSNSGIGVFNIQHAIEKVVERIG